MGQYLNISLSKNFEILTMYHKQPGNALKFNSVKGDIKDFAFLRKVLYDFKPNVIVHNAAVSNSSLADEVGKEETLQVNVEATKTIAELSEELGARLIFNSTDLVYAESDGKLLNEDAPLGPASLYAESKVMAEESISASTSDFVILRNALMYGFGLNHSRNHFHRVFENLREGKEVLLFTDQFRTPIELSNAAELIGEIIKKNISGEMLNFGGSERVSRLQLGQMLCDAFGFDKSLLKAVALKDSPVKYKVKDVSMNINKMLNYGLKPLSIKASMNLFRKINDEQ